MAPQIPILLVGTANAHKLREISALLKDLPVRLQGAAILPEPVAPAEDGETFEENACRKALAFAAAAARILGPDRPLWALSDDSGLCVDALGGAPGVLSARYARGAADSPPPSTPAERDGANNRKLLQALAGVEPKLRSAAFVCAVACAEVPRAGGTPRIVLEARGECRGRILEAPRGAAGFGYDPLFLAEGTGRTYAELGDAEKNRISHRGRALQAFSRGLRPLLIASGPQLAALR